MCKGCNCMEDAAILLVISSCPTHLPTHLPDSWLASVYAWFSLIYDAAHRLPWSLSSPPQPCIFKPDQYTTLELQGIFIHGNLRACLVLHILEVNCMHSLLERWIFQLFDDIWTGTVCFIRHTWHRYWSSTSMRLKAVTLIPLFLHAINYVSKCINTCHLSLKR